MINLKKLCCKAILKKFDLLYNFYYWRMTSHNGIVEILFPCLVFGYIKKILNHPKIEENIEKINLFTQ